MSGSDKSKLDSLFPVIAEGTITKGGSADIVTATGSYYIAKLTSGNPPNGLFLIDAHSGMGGRASAVCLIGYQNTDFKIANTAISVGTGTYESGVTITAPSHSNCNYKIYRLPF